MLGVIVITFIGYVTIGVIFIPLYLSIYLYRKQKSVFLAMSPSLHNHCDWLRRYMDKYMRERKFHRKLLAAQGVDAENSAVIA